MKRSYLRSAFLYESRSLLGSIRTYVYFAITLASQIYLVIALNLAEIGIASIESTVSILYAFYMLAMPALTVCAFSGQRERIRALRSLGMPQTSLFFGKFLAITVNTLIPLSVLTVIPPILSMFGEINFLSAYLSIFGFALFCIALAAALTTVSLLCDSLKIGVPASYALVVLFYLGNRAYGYLTLDNLAILAVFFCVALILGGGIYLFSKNILTSVGSAVLFLACTGITVFAAPMLSLELARAMLRFFSICTALLGFTTEILDIGAIIRLIIFTAFVLTVSVAWIKKSEHAEKGGVEK